MGTKTISIMDDVYGLLVNKKTKEESFSDVIRRVLTRKGNIMDYAGSWKDISDKNINEMKEDIESLRKKSTKELIKNDMH